MSAFIFCLRGLGQYIIPQSLIRTDPDANRGYQPEQESSEYPVLVRPKHHDCVNKIKLLRLLCYSSIYSHRRTLAVLKI